MSTTFLGNIIDPNRADFNKHIIHEDYGTRTEPSEETMEKLSTSYHGNLKPAPSKEFVLEKMQDWLKYKIINDPVPPKFSPYSVAELKEQGYVGVYCNASHEREQRRAETATPFKLDYPKNFRFEKDGSVISLDETYNAQEANRIKKVEEYDYGFKR